MEGIIAVGTDPDGSGIPSGILDAIVPLANANDTTKILINGNLYISITLYNILERRCQMN
ncbi:hypothetical protein NBRC116495_17210 [Aurantivibrio plasticivorans]